MGKHAYLIMVHENTYVLEKSLQLIDDERNDIYIHVDLRAKEFKFEFYKKLVKKSRIIYIEQHKVNWASFSQVETEILLLEISSREKYDFYHLLSGSCLPIKSQDSIHQFFNANKNKEFISIKGHPDEWAKYYYFFTESNYYRTNKIIKMISRKLFILPQKLLGINRLGKSKTYWSYSWFSISNELAEYIVRNKESIRRKFKYTHAPDEVFLATTVMNEEKFKGRIYNIEDYTVGSLREIQFYNGKPTIINKNDLQRLRSSQCMFARKFDSKVDKEIIDIVFNEIRG